MGFLLNQKALVGSQRQLRFSGFLEGLPILPNSPNLKKIQILELCFKWLMVQNLYNLYNFYNNYVSCVSIEAHNRGHICTHDLKHDPFAGFVK